MNNTMTEELRNEFDKWLKDYEGGDTFPDIASWWLAKIESSYIPKQRLKEVVDKDVESMAEAVHNTYLTTCKKLGWEVKTANLVPYSELSEDSKELDRASVRATLTDLITKLNLKD